MAKKFDESIYMRPKEPEKKDEEAPESGRVSEDSPKQAPPEHKSGGGEDWSVPEPAPVQDGEQGDAAKPEKVLSSAVGRMYASDDGRGRTAKKVAVGIFLAVLFLIVSVITLSNFVDSPALQGPKKVVSVIVSPIQRVFSAFTDSVASYFRTLKIRGNIEYEYDRLLEQLDELASDAAMAEEYRIQVEQLNTLLEETRRNRSMDPLMAAVIAHDNSNYFSVLTVDVGSANGVKENMAVVFSGGLVGYTYGVEQTSCKVLCIIDGNATVAAMIQSSRDQGSVKGTMGIDGQPMCRMYYLPESSLPRPGDLVVTSGVGTEFPKGIPIGYVRESTRGLDENKSYIVVEPIVDFQHLEYVVVYRYQPAYAEAVQQRSSNAQTSLMPLVTARPQPTFQIGEDASQPEGTEAPETPTPTPDEGSTEEPGAESTASASPEGTQHPDNLTYQAATGSGTATPSPSPTPRPSPTPAPTFNPEELTIEDE